MVEGVHVIYGSWFSWKYDSLLRFGIGGPKNFPRVAATIISNRFVKLINSVHLNFIENMK